MDDSIVIISIAIFSKSVLKDTTNEQFMILFQGNPESSRVIKLALPS